jgi:hypothetical protein
VVWDQEKSMIKELPPPMERGGLAGWRVWLLPPGKNCLARAIYVYLGFAIDV